MVVANTDMAIAISPGSITTGRIEFCFTAMAHTGMGIRRGIPAGTRITTATLHTHRITTTRTRHGDTRLMALEHTGRMAGNFWSASTLQPVDLDALSEAVR